jgi:uncharacterized membrane protein
MVLLLVGSFWFRPSGDRLQGKKLWTLRSLRLGVILLLAVMMIRPTLVYTETTHLPATLLLLLDQSRSMSVEDEFGNQSRYRAAQLAIEQAGDAFQEIDADFEIQGFTFDEALHPVPFEQGFDFPESPEGKETAIGRALESALERMAGKRVLGTLLMSDGAQRTLGSRNILPQEAATRYRDAGHAIYTMRFGNTTALGQTRDLSLSDLVANERVFVKNEMAVSGRLRAYGYVNETIPLELLFENDSGEMELVDRQEMEVTEEGESLPFQFLYAPTTPGQHKLTVRVAPQPKELVKTNNRISTFVDVLKGGLKVLLIDTRRFEQKFLRMALDASADIHVDYLRISSSEDANPPDLSTFFAPGKYAVYLLGDVDATAFRQQDLQQLAETVADGAGLMMLGGYHSFGAGGYARTPLQEVLPIQLSAVDRQPLDGEIRKDLHYNDPLAVLPTTIGNRHFMLTMAATPENNLALWRSLPLLEGANRLGQVKSSGIVLAEGPGEEPLLVSQLYGNGRVLAFAGDTTWQWWMQGYQDFHRRFWRQVVLWLAKKDESLDGDVWIEIDQRRVFPGTTVEFKIHVRGESGKEIQSPEATATIRSPDGSEKEIPLVDENGTLIGSVRETRLPGDYALRVQAMTEEGETKQTSTRFLVVDQDMELENPAADPTVLQSLAAMTGGNSLVPEQLPDLLKELSSKGEELIQKHQTTKSLWDHWWLFLLFLVLISLEWFLRKRWGMV